MTDAQYLFDLAAKQYNEVADSVEKHFESVADQIRGWMPQQMRPSPPPPPPRRLVPITAYHRVERWISHNRASTAGIVAFLTTGVGLLYFQKRIYYKKRRAKRASNNARIEVVVVAGSPTSPLTTAIALDLERRGFIVYMIAHSAEDEQHIRSQSRVDIMPLTLDLVYPEKANDQISRLQHLLSHDFMLEGSAKYRLSLAGVVLVPDTQSEAGPITELSPDTWATALNAKVLNTILTTQQLMPLVTEYSGRVLLVTPSIVPSLRPPHYGVQSTVSGALDGFAGTLASELSLQNIKFSQFKLGYMELPGQRQREAGLSKARTRGTPMRRLHDSLFDALQAKRPRQTWHIGKGSLVYDVIGGWVPSGMVGWMMGLRRADSQRKEEQRLLESEGSDGSGQWEKL